MTWFKSIVAPAVVAVLISGSVSIGLQLLSSQEVKEREQRLRSAETYLGFVTSQATASGYSEFEMRNLSSRNRLFVFGDSEVIRHLAASYQAQSSHVPKLVGPETRSQEWSCACKVLVDKEKGTFETWRETDESRQVVLQSIQPILSMRSIYRPDDPVDPNDALRVVCSTAGLCFGVCLVSHLRPCT